MNGKIYVSMLKNFCNERQKRTAFSGQIFYFFKYFQKK